MLTSELARSRSPLSISDIFSPLSMKEFVDEYWEKEHLFLSRDGDNPYASIFGFGDVDRYIAVAKGHLNAYMSLGKTGEDGKVRMHRTRVGDVAQKEVFKAFHAGSTIMLDSIHEHWPNAAELAAVVGDAFGASVKINAYVTPPGFQGAPIHPDIQDVLALQTEGSKEWYIYDQRFFEPVETIGLMPYVNKDHFFPSDDIAVKEKRMIHAGDLLYVPRGVTHKAVAPADAPSVHLALCITPFYWVDFLKSAADIASAALPELATSLPLGYERSEADQDAMKAKFRNLLERLGEDGLFEETLRVMREVRSAESSQVGDGHLEQLLHLDAITLESNLRRRAGFFCSTRSNNKGAQLTYGPDGKLTGPVALQEAFEHICRNETFRVADLPGPISDSSKLNVAKRLVREGLLRVESV